jgi:hypothetical protein
MRVRATCLALYTPQAGRTLRAVCATAYQGGEGGGAIRGGGLQGDTAKAGAMAVPYPGQTQLIAVGKFATEI